MFKKILFIVVISVLLGACSASPVTATVPPAPSAVSSEPATTPSVNIATSIPPATPSATPTAPIPTPEETPAYPLPLRGTAVHETISEKIYPLKVRTTTYHQTIAGFGASGAWWAKDVGGWEADKVDRIIGLLFDRQKGIGLNIYRYEVGGGGVNNATDPWRYAETFETAPGKYDWNRNANAVNVLRKAVAAGVDNVMFFANSPPGRMTVNGRTTGGNSGGSNLKPRMEGDFARYLVDIAQHFRSEGIPVKYISPFNEPQGKWQESNGQEGCHYEPDQVVSMARALARELKARNSSIRPSLIDSSTWLDKRYTVELYKRLAEDKDVGPLMDHYAVHSYYSSAADKESTVKLLKASGVKLPLWQTEWCQMEYGVEQGMGPALTLARTVHEDMVITDCQAWIAWLAVSNYNYKDGLVYVDVDTRDILETKRMWALGNYSRFIRPGYRRVEVAGAPGSLLTSAYKSTNGQSIVLVAVNDSQDAVMTDITAKGFTAFKAYETSETRSLELVAQGATGEYTFPPLSVTTLVLRRS